MAFETIFLSEPFRTLCTTKLVNLKFSTVVSHVSFQVAPVFKAAVAIWTAVVHCGHY